MNLGIIGLGYWGPNIVRNAVANPNVKNVLCCDIDADQLKKIQERHQEVRITQSVEEVLNDPAIDAVAVVTPVDMHHKLARQALEHGKHVLIEKPFTSTVAEGEELLELADKKGLITMVDHTFLYTGAVRATKKLCDSGELGNILYYDSVRANLGLFQRDVNVIWDLAPHDFSIMNEVIKGRPKTLRAMGGDHVGRGLSDVAYVFIDYGDEVIAHFHLSWVSPEKIRKTIIGGDKKMLVYDDMEPKDKVRVYDKGFEVKERPGTHPLIQYRNGEAENPELESTEALALLIQEFYDAINENRPPLTSGKDGLDVVRILEATDKSIKAGGKEIQI